MGGKAPKAPDLTPLAYASENIGRESLELGREELAWAKEQFQRSSELTEKVLGTQLPIMQATWEQSQADRARYEQLYQPLEETLIKDFESYGSPERLSKVRGEAIADVGAAFTAQRQNAMRQLEGYGIDPSMTRYQALDVAMRTDEAAAKAFAANQARERAEAKSDVYRAAAIDIGRGVPGQAMALAGMATQTGAQAQSGLNQAIATGSNTRNAAGQWYGQALSGYNQAANIHNMGYQNQMAEYQANMTMSPMAQAAQMGASLGGAFLGGVQEGGAIPADVAPIPGPADKYPVLLAEGEYVVPAEVVKAKGTEFFDRLKEKYTGIPVPEQRTA